MKILITGANGFIGSWLTRKLVELEHEVHVLHRDSSDLSEIDDLEFKSHIGDITNLESLIEASQGMDTVFHLAGLIGYTPGLRAVMELVNVQGTKNVVQACKENKVKQLVYLSSVVAIGASFNGKQPLNEESLYNIKHLNLGYFETKREAEQIVIDAYKKGIVEPIIVNPSTVYGPGDAKKGSRKTQLKVAKGQFPFYTSGGVNIVHIRDVIDAIIKAWEYGAPGERYILAGENITIKELFQLIAEAAGTESPKIKLPDFLLHGIGAWGDFLERIGFKGPISSENAWTSTLFHWFDSSKAQKQLGLKVTPAKEAIQESVTWSKENNLL